MSGVLAISLFCLMLVGVPIGFALGIASLAAIAGGPMPMALLPQRIFAGLDSFPLIAAPLFILAGSLMESGGLSLRLVALATSIVGHIKGGMGMVVVLSTMLFSGISGSSTADTAAIGSVMIPAMVRRGYRPEMAAAVVAVAGGAGILIPPSLLIIFYGLATGTSIAALFLAGVIPGIFMGASLLVYIYLTGEREGIPVQSQFSVGAVARAFGRSLLALCMPIIIMWGILGGVFTVTEAAVTAVVFALLVSTVVYRELGLRDLPRIFVDAGMTTGVVMLVVGAASLFAWLMTTARVPQYLAESLTAISSNWVFFLILVNIAFLVLGCVFEVTAALIMMIPLIFPAALSYGIDPVHLGIVLVANLGIGLVTPPVGMCLFVACGIGKVPIDRVVRPMIPFLFVMVTSLLVITYVPELTLVLPRWLLGYRG